MAELGKPQRERAAILCADGVAVSADEPRVFALEAPSSRPIEEAPAPRGDVGRTLALALFGVSSAVAAAVLWLTTTSSPSVRGPAGRLAEALPPSIPGWAPSVMLGAVPVLLGVLAAWSWLTAKRAGARDRDSSAAEHRAPDATSARDRTLRFDGRTIVLSSWRESAAPSTRRHDKILEAAKLRESGKQSAMRTREERLLADVSGRFGVTLLSNRRRDRIAAAITSPAGCFLVASRVANVGRNGGRSGRSAGANDAGREAAGDRRALDPQALAAFLGRATVISADEVALDAIGPDGEPIVLAFPDFRALVETLESLDPGALDRVLLSDPSGTPLELDGEDLSVRGRHFDLTRPLEWRSILFQEQFGQALTLYQGTWIRQGGEEVVLVSLLPPSVLDPSPHDFEAAGLPELDLAAMRDQRLMQASAGEPPPMEQRVAVDGLFMLPLRVALDQAPRSSHQPRDTRHA
jgi:hypothetical protein